MTGQKLRIVNVMKANLLGVEEGNKGLWLKGKQEAFLGFRRNVLVQLECNHHYVMRKRYRLGWY